VADADLLQIVDDNDNPVGGATRGEANERALNVRVVRILIEDEHGNILLQKRSSQVGLFPNCWDSAAAGHVDLGEEYDESAARELKEELGLNIPLEKFAYYQRQVPALNGKTRTVFAAAYKAIVERDTPLILQESEVAETKWFTLDELRSLITQHPDDVTSGLADVFNRFYKDK
jgi:isopentenyldiphosphate isomerase